MKLQNETIINSASQIFSKEVRSIKGVNVSSTYLSIDSKMTSPEKRI